MYVAITQNKETVCLSKSRLECLSPLPPPLPPLKSHQLDRTRRDIRMTTIHLCPRVILKLVTVAPGAHLLYLIVYFNHSPFILKLNNKTVHVCLFTNLILFIYCQDIKLITI